MCCSQTTRWFLERQALKKLPK
ncbi:hypothetical protein LINPERHAP1_LOCUS8432 [Linum perenne]